MKYADLFWVTLPDRGGREQRGRRPAVIWQDTDIFKLPTVLIIPFSTQLDALRFGGTTLVHPNPTNGLLAPSVAMVFQLGACDGRRLGLGLGVLDQSDVDTLRQLARLLQKL